MDWKRKDYLAEYRAFQEMKRRMGLKGLPISSTLDTFQHFMDAVGPKPSPSHSLDRIDNNNPVYEAGNVRWASKADQSNNRRNTTRLSYTGSEFPQWSGHTKPLSVWARLLNVNPALMRQQRYRDWSDNEIIEGRRSARVKVFEEMSLKELAAYRPWSAENAEKNEGRYLEGRKSGEGRLEYRARVLGDEATHKWQALLKVAAPKNGRATFAEILSAKFPEREFAAYRDVSQEEFRICIQEWRDLATRWLDALDDADRWRAASIAKQNGRASDLTSQKADSDVLKQIQGTPLSSKDVDQRRGHEEDDPEG